MKRWLIGLGCCAALGLFVQPAFSQDQANVTWNGGVDLQAWYTQNPNDLSADFNDDAAFLQERATLGATAELADNTWVVIEAGFFNVLGDVVALGASTEMAGGSELYLNKGYVQVKQLFTDKLSVSLGRQPMAYALPVPEDAAKHGGFRNGALYFDSAANNKQITSFDGLLVQLSLDDVMVDIFAITLMETTPGQFAGGKPSDNWGDIGVHVSWQQEGLYIHGLVDAHSGLDLPFGVGTNGSINTVTGGTVVDVGENLEVFGELAFQTGKLVNVFGDDVAITGLALYIGANFSMESAFVGGEIAMASGNDDEEDLEEAFLFWESREPTLIVEGEQMYDVTSNYVKFQVWGGYSFELDGKASQIKGTIAMYNAQDDTQGGGFGNFGNQLAVVPDEAAIGMELDVGWTYAIAEAVDLGVTLGMFMPGDAVWDDADNVMAACVKVGASF